MPNPAGSFIWYELMTPDPYGAKAFYDAVVGWNIDAHSTGPEGTDYRMINRAGSGFAGGVLKLDDAMQAHGARPMWLGYVNVDDVDGKVAKLTVAGGKAIMPPFDAPGIGRIALVADPQGAPIYVMKPIPPASDPDASSDVFSIDQPGHINWNELSTSDPASALDFYRDHFGWESPEAMDMGEFGKYHFLFHDSVRIGALAGLSPGQQPAWRYYIGVASIDRSIEAVNTGGGTIERGPHEVPGGSFIVIGKDPQGAEFALVGPR